MRPRPQATPSLAPSQKEGRTCLSMLHRSTSKHIFSVFQTLFSVAAVTERTSFSAKRKPTLRLSKKRASYFLLQNTEHGVSVSRLGSPGQLTYTHSKDLIREVGIEYDLFPVNIFEFLTVFRIVHRRRHITEHIGRTTSHCKA